MVRLSREVFSHEYSEIISSYCGQSAGGNIPEPETKRKANDH